MRLHMGSLIVSHGHGLSRLMVMVHGRGSSMEKNDGELIFYFSIEIGSAHDLINRDLMVHDFGIE